MKKQDVMERFYMAAKKVKNPSRYTLGKLAKKHGFKFLDEGCYGTVYKHAKVKDKVMKIGRAKYGSRKDAYYAYARYVHKNKKHLQNPHFPNISKLRLVGSNYMAVIERLHEVDHDDIPFNLWHASDVVRRPDDEPEIKNTQVVAALKDIGRYCYRQKNGHTYCTDFHRGNVMKRKNGEIVITDPLS